MADFNTDNLALSQYDQFPQFLTDYNSDMQTIDESVTAAGVHPVDNVKNGDVHEVTGLGNGSLFQFTAAGDFEEGDSFTVNGATASLYNAEGEAVARPWKNGDKVLLAKIGSEYRVLTPLYSKANKGIPTRKPLTLLNGAKNYSTSPLCSWYTKNDFGMVTVYAYFINQNNAALEPETAYISMPEGYWPEGSRGIGTCHLFKLGDTAASSGVVLPVIARIENGSCHISFVKGASNYTNQNCCVMHLHYYALG